MGLRKGPEGGQGSEGLAHHKTNFSRKPVDLHQPAFLLTRARPATAHKVLAFPPPLVPRRSVLRLRPHTVHPRMVANPARHSP